MKDFWAFYGIFDRRTVSGACVGTFSYSGKAQFITVAATGEYDIVALGGSGGNGPDGEAGGLGAEAAGTFQLTAGEKLEIVVGGAGGNAAATSSGGGGGGGGSFVLANTGPGGSYVPLIVAGGGGGAFETSGGQGTTESSGDGFGGASGHGDHGTSYSGGGGAGVLSAGLNGNLSKSGGYGGYDAPTFKGGKGGGDAAAGGFGGGGGGGADDGGGGGGGGYTGGSGGYGSSAAAASTGGTSFDSGTAIGQHTLDGVNSGNGSISIPGLAMCFVEGTRIRTVRGDVAVEDLAPGDVVVTSSSKRRPTRWIGHRKIERPPLEQCPVRIAAHAFGPNLPSRDLYLSPGHPVLVGHEEDGDGGHLVPIMCLINGTTIERMAVDAVTYWHVELDEHDILLAEGLPAESYIDLGSRPWFDGADGALYDPDMVLPGLAGRCRPVAIDGPVVQAERRRLDILFATRLAGACAWPQHADPAVLTV